ncbi:MAG: carboxymuconolactone decarboxylase family protein [Micavibrio sp.]|nr:carboxymuconolactone decarboxylase family protein [Micavibrio sp.]
MAQQSHANASLSPAEKNIVTIAAFTANGDLKKLDTALRTGLDAGLTVNECKEVLIQMYAYAGFPRSLNGINTLMQVLGDRKKSGKTDIDGKDASPLPANADKDDYGAKVRATLAGQSAIPAPAGYQLFAPTIDAFLKQHLFADIFARDALDFKQRELATISALAAMTGTQGQLRFHLKAAMNTGLSEEQLKDFVAVLAESLGSETATNVQDILTEVLGQKP